jgi:hypothetical protein
VVPVEGEGGDQQAAELLGGVGPPPGPAEHGLGIDLALGGRTRWTGLAAINCSSTAACRMRFSSDRHAITRL